MQVLMRVSLCLALSTVACTQLAAADLNFCWRGANGFTMTGRMTLPDAALYRELVTEKDVTRFKIAGYRDGSLLGTWDMADRTPDTTWHLRFIPIAMEFPTGDTFAGEKSQGWNADGDVSNCGAPGFGFNAGNWAQDICVNGAYVADSSIPPMTPLLATTNPVAPDCGSSPVSSKTQKPESSPLTANRF